MDEAKMDDGESTRGQRAPEGGAADVFAVVLQIPDLTIAMTEELDATGGDVRRAAADVGLGRIWGDAAPDARAAVLLSLAWEARDQQLPDAMDTAGRHAAELRRSAAQRAGSDEAFLGQAFPVQLLPYRGRTGDVAGTLAFDPDAAQLSLTVALLLLAAIRSADDGEAHPWWEPDPEPSPWPAPLRRMAGRLTRSRIPNEEQEQER
jgi:hypothetical protein